MNICKEIEEGCNLPSSPNDIKILLNQVKREITELTKNTEAKVLIQDRTNCRTMCLFKKQFI